MLYKFDSQLKIPLLIWVQIHRKDVPLYLFLCDIEQQKHIYSFNVNYAYSNLDSLSMFEKLF